jgi:hypothetical protein
LPGTPSVTSDETSTCIVRRVDRSLQRKFFLNFPLGRHLQIHANAAFAASVRAFVNNHG